MNWNDEVALNNIAQQRTILKGFQNDLGDEECIEKAAGIISRMELEKGFTDEDIQKALDISRLRRVRVLVTRRDGVVYQKTVYKKLEEVNDETAQAYTGQAQIEQNLAAGTPVHLKWTGSATGTSYETDKAEIVSFTANHITVKFTEPFATHNANSYTYSAGSTITVPRIGTEAWNTKNYVKPIVRTPVVMDVLPPVNVSRTITSTTEARIGDKIEITQGDSVRTGVVTYIYTPREGVTYQSAAGRTAKLKVKFEDGSETYVIPSSNRNTVRILEGDNAPTLSFDAQVTQLRAEGFNLTFPTVSNNVPNGTEEYQIQVRVDRFGNENRRGQSTAMRTRTRTIFRQATPEERANADSTGIAMVKPKYSNFNLVEFTREFKAAFESSGLGTFDPRELKFRWSSDHQLELKYHSGNLTMTRNFSYGTDSVFQVYHAYFKVEPGVRNRGAMKAIFKTLYKQYKNIGIERLKVSANIDVGGYTWAKTGFRAEQYEARNHTDRMSYLVGHTRNIGIDKITRQPMTYTITQSDADEAKRRFDSFYRVNDGSTKFPMRLLASISDGKAGKALLLHESWAGSIDLRKPDQRTDFENYIYNVETP